MLVVIAKAECRPDKRAEMVAALKTVSAASRQEPGCRSHRFLADLENENAFASIEEWENQEAIAAHFASPHVGALMAALPDLLAGAPVIEVHDVASTTGPPGA
ncbi:MAG: putative quinol monooxygenase [Mycobacteriales bacterium]